MGRSRFPGKPLKFQNRKRISVLSGTVYHETAPESHPPARGNASNDFAGEQEVNLVLCHYMPFVDQLLENYGRHTVMFCLRNNYKHYEALIVW